MADTTSSTVSTSSVANLTNIHERNDICLRISPFDSFKKISLYKLNDDSTYSDFDVTRTDYCKYYLQFGETGKTVRVDEYTDTYTENDEEVNIDSNELMFKITQAKAKDILNLKSDVFYLVREIINEDTYGDSTVVSTQEIFSGRWADSTEYQTTNYQATIDTLQNDVSKLMDALSDANGEILRLNNEILELTKENEDLQGYQKYKDLYEELSNSINMSNEYEAEVIDSTAKYVKVDIDDETLASQVNTYLDTLNT